MALVKAHMSHNIWDIARLICQSDIAISLHSVAENPSVEEAADVQRAEID